MRDSPAATAAVEASPDPPPSQSNPRLLALLRARLRLGHYSLRTEEAYRGWAVRFIRYHGLRHPRDMAEPEVLEFLRYLAEDRKVAAATQEQALAALLFLYRDVLDRPLRLAGRVARGRAPSRLPAVLTRDEVVRVVNELPGTYRLIGLLLYGSGLRLLECLTLRVKDVDLDRGEIRIRRGKGAKDRVTVLPRLVGEALGAHLAEVLDLAHEESRDAYQQRDLSRYLAAFTPDLVYRGANGRAYSREQLGRQVHAQFSHLVAADTRFSRESLTVDGEQAVETGTQAAFAAVRIGLIFARRWTIHRRCRVTWRRAAHGWLISAVDVLDEHIRGSSFGLARAMLRGVSGQGHG